MYKNEELEQDRQKLLEVQRHKRTFVSVREAIKKLGYAPTATGAARYKLEAMVAAGMAVKTGSHYHIVEDE